VKLAKLGAAWSSLEQFRAQQGSKWLAEAQWPAISKLGRNSNQIAD
jgi:hypothetical protein